MSIDTPHKKIIVSEDVYNNLEADVKLSALLLRRSGKLEITPSQPEATSR
jgi:hypothetical protein